jgi:Tol biopolymer transport system component
MFLVLSACTEGAVATSPSPTQPAGSTAQPAIGDLVDVHGESIDVSSLRGRIVFSGGTQDIYTVNADGSGLEPLTTSEDLEFDPTWSPDRRAIAYRHQRDFESPIDIFVMDADGSHRRNLTGTEELAGWGPDWSADGEWIAWNSATDTTTWFDLGLIHSDGTGRRMIKPGVYVEYPPGHRTVTGSPS